jgi:hypothetical protein
VGIASVKRISCAGILISALIIAAPRSYLLAQVSGALQVQPKSVLITGRVVGPNGAPISNASVTAAALNRHVSAAARTDSLGQFNLRIATGSDQFFITVDAPRMLRVQISATSPDGGPLTIPDIRLEFSPSTLKPVRIRGQVIRPEPRSTITAGSAEEFVPAERADQIVVDQSILESLALIVPGAVTSIGIDGLPTYSVAGAPSSQNSITVDGATSSSGPIPRDAIAGSVVTTTTSDVSRGRFGGGQISAWTVHGSSSRRSAMHLWGTSPLLQGTSGIAPNPTQFSDLHVSGTTSGQLGLRPLFYFGAIQLGIRRQDLGSYVGASPERLSLVGVSPDSVARLATVANRLLVPLTIPSGMSESSNTASGLLDVTVRRAAPSALDLRVNANLGSQRPSPTPFINSPATGLNAQDRGIDLHVDWTATVRDKILNTFQTTASVASQWTKPLFAIPAAGVTIAGADGTASPALWLGGPGTSSRRERRISWETTNESAYQTQDSRHRLRFGEFFRVERLSFFSSDDDAGTFTFSSLSDFENDSPASFTRMVGETRHGADAYSSALFASDRWRMAGARVEWQYGLRLEDDHFREQSSYNAQIDTLFTLRTDRTPSEFHVSPRIGVSWRYGHGPGGRPRGEFRLAGGEYRGVIPTATVDQVASRNLDNASRQILCVGSAVPPPTWQAFVGGSDPPSQCIATAPSGLSQPGLDASGFAQKYRAPTSWRMTSSVSGSIGDWLVVGIDALYSRGFAQPSVVDLNLRQTPRFFLSAENERPVYANAQAVIANSGLIAPNASRANPNYGGVWRYQSDLGTDARQITVRANLPTGFTVPGYWRVAYTLSRVHDQTRGYNGDTGGDPRGVESSRSALERRHQFLVIGTLPATRWFTTFLTGRFSSGSPYSPLVASDINGDGRINDRAFVFSPISPDTLVSAGMRELLHSGLGRGALNCLTSQVGKIARRNGCSGPWTAAVDVHSEIRPGRFGLSDRVSATVRVLNVFAGLDELLHGPSRMKGWGEPAAPDRILLAPVGFDTTNRRFNYRVNPHFGRTDGAQTGFVNPFRISLDVRVLVGPDPRKNDFLEAIGQGPGDGGHKPTAEELKARFGEQVPDPFRMLLSLTDSLGLTPEQVSHLTAMQAAYAKDIDSLWDQALGSLNLGSNALNVSRGVRELNEASMEVQRRQIRWGHAIRAVLSPTQRDQTPLYVQHIMFDNESTVEPLIR